MTKAQKGVQGNEAAGLPTTAAKKAGAAGSAAKSVASSPPGKLQSKNKTRLPRKQKKALQKASSKQSIA
jgi:hypothetical protein